MLTGCKLLQDSHPLQPAAWLKQLHRHADLGKVEAIPKEVRAHILQATGPFAVLRLCQQPQEQKPKPQFRTLCALYFGEHTANN